MAVGLVTAQGVTGVEQAQAYCTSGIGRWFYADYTPHIRSSIPAGWNAHVTAAITRWNGISGSTLHYYAPYFKSPVANPEFQVYRLSFRSVGFPDVPGIASGSQVQNHRTVEIGLNSDFAWNISGVMSSTNRQVDVQTILVHEAGHASGLAHPYPSVCGAGHPTTAEKAGVMNVTWAAKRLPSADDKAGIAGRY
jgi:hypothetical protein